MRNKALLQKQIYEYVTRNSPKKAELKVRSPFRIRNLPKVVARSPKRRINHKPETRGGGQGVLESRALLPVRSRNQLHEKGNQRKLPPVSPLEKEVLVSTPSFSQILKMRPQIEPL
jgi:hypothetical protein